MLDLKKDFVILKRCIHMPATRPRFILNKQNFNRPSVEGVQEYEERIAENEKVLKNRGEL